MPYQTLDVRLVNRELVLDVDGKGSLPMVPLSVTRFANRSLELDFKADTGGVVNAVQLIPAGVPGFGDKLLLTMLSNDKRQVPITVVR